jgi:non-homologous end joining protein Ku
MAALQDLLERKKNGMPIAKAAAPSKGNVINLMDALKASLKTTGKNEPAVVTKPSKSAKKCRLSLIQAFTGARWG